MLKWKLELTQSILVKWAAPVSSSNNSPLQTCCQNDTFLWFFVGGLLFESDFEWYSMMGFPSKKLKINLFRFKWIDTKNEPMNFLRIKNSISQQTSNRSRLSKCTRTGGCHLNYSFFNISSVSSNFIPAYLQLFLSIPTESHRQASWKAKTRTINKLAFEWKMFNIENTKKCFQVCRLLLIFALRFPMTVETIAVKKMARNTVVWASRTWKKWFQNS